jgi:phage-related protein
VGTKIVAIQDRVKIARDNIGVAWALIKQKIIDPISAGITGAVSYMAGFPGRVSAAIGNAGSWLYQKGRAIIQGLINGIKAMIPNLAGAVAGAVSIITNLLPGSPVKTGPLVVFNQLSTNPGAKLAKMLGEGFNSQMQAFAPALAVGGVGNVTVNPAIANPPVTVHVMLDGREIASTVHAVVDERNLQMKRAVTSGGSRLP